MPAVSTCDLLASDTALGEITYPAAWSTVSEPTDLACRYFDRDPITVPSDPTTLKTAIMVTTSTATYADMVAEATDGGPWTAVEARRQAGGDVGRNRPHLVAPVDRHETSDRQPSGSCGLVGSSFDTCLSRMNDDQHDGEWV